MDEPASAGWLTELVRTGAAWVAAASLWLAETVLTLGYPGIVALMAIESSLIPFPSELVMPPAGYLVHEGQMSWFPVIACGIAGSMLGAWFNYFLALRLGRPFLLCYGKYVFLKPEDMHRAERFFARHGEITTFVGRLIPVVRQLISLPAGAARMNFGKFTLYTALGAGIWVVILTWIGWLVGRNQDMLKSYLQSASIWLVGGAVVIVIAYIKLYRRRHP